MQQYDLVLYMFVCVCILCYSLFLYKLLQDADIAPCAYSRSLLVSILYTDAVQLQSLVWLFATLWTAICQALLSFTISLSLLKFMFTESVMLSNHLHLCHHLLLPSVFPSIRVFSSESALCIRWPKFWNFSFSISPSNEYSGLICFRIDWFCLPAVQGTLKSLL